MTTFDHHSIEYNRICTFNNLKFEIGNGERFLLRGLNEGYKRWKTYMMICQPTLDWSIPEQAVLSYYNTGDEQP